VNVVGMNIYKTLWRNNMFKVLDRVKINEKSIEDTTFPDDYYPPNDNYLLVVGGTHISGTYDIKCTIPESILTREDRQDFVFKREELCSTNERR
jgi:hypothetical protein